MLGMRHSSMERPKLKTEAFTTWLEQAFLKVTKKKKNGAVQQKHKQKSINAKSIVHQTTL